MRWTTHTKLHVSDAKTGENTFFIHSNCLDQKNLPLIPNIKAAAAAGPSSCLYYRKRSAGTCLGGSEARTPSKKKQTNFVLPIPSPFFRGYKFALPVFQQKKLPPHSGKAFSLRHLAVLAPIFFCSFFRLDLHFLELTYPLPAGTFERMIFPTSFGWDMFFPSPGG